MDERETIAQCLQGDVEAFGALVRRHQAALLALAWRLLGNRDDARDVVQEALLQAFHRLADYDPARPLRTWLFAITARKAIDGLRRRRSFLAFFNRQCRERDWRAATNPAGEGIEESPLFHSLLARLGAKERTAIVLRVNEDCSAREIAEVLGCRESTARAHLLNARRKLKRELSRLGTPVQGRRIDREDP